MRLLLLLLLLLLLRVVLLLLLLLLCLVVLGLVAVGATITLTIAARPAVLVWRIRPLDFRLSELGHIIPLRVVIIAETDPMRDE